LTACNGFSQMVPPQLAELRSAENKLREKYYEN